MARIKDSSVEAVKSSAEILPLVEDYVRLRKAGGTYKGLCPFHQEKTPSFTVTPARGTFKCFGCGEGGDAISFVERLENVDFVGAIEHLAKRFGVEIEYEEISPEADRARRQKERLGQLLERATLFYERLLWESDQAEFVREYLASRGLGDEVCRQFRLGYAPGGPTLTRRAAQEGFGGDELLAAGLANRRGNDYFNRRLLFPLTDARGNVRGFQARKLHDDDPLQAKYVNSPESDVFKKGDLLYGLDSGRQAIAKQDRAVVVEGNTDVLALRQAGFEPVVASMGTALTERQLRELNRLTKRLILCFDSDAAGQDATLRGMELAVGLGFDVQIVTLPKGTDPADDPVALEQQLHSPVSPVHRVRLEHDRARDSRARSPRFERSSTRSRLTGTAARGSSRCRPARSPDRDAAGLAFTRGGSRVVSPRLLDAGSGTARARRGRGVSRAARILEELGVGVRPRSPSPSARAPAGAGACGRRADAAPGRALCAGRQREHHPSDGEATPPRAARARARARARCGRQRPGAAAPAGADQSPGADPRARLGGRLELAADPR
jgi:DNA primase catalytic core